MAINAKRSYTEYLISAPTTDFAIGFDDYNADNRDVINVTVDRKDAVTEGFTVTRISPTVIQLSPAVGTGRVVRLQRETNVDDTFHKFSDGAKFNALSVDENFEQILHSQQEVNDSVTQLSFDVNDALGRVEDAIDRANEASEKIEDAWNNIANASAINGVAEIRSDILGGYVYPPKPEKVLLIGDTVPANTPYVRTSYGLFAVVPKATGAVTAITPTYAVIGGVNCYYLNPTSSSENALWQGGFAVWQLNSVFASDPLFRKGICDGWTLARAGFADDKALAFKARNKDGGYACRVYRAATNTNTASAILVANMSPRECEGLLNKNVGLYIDAIKSEFYTGTAINVKVIGSSESLQAITRDDGMYTSGNRVLLDKTIDFSTYSTDMGLFIPKDIYQLAVVITVPFTGTAGDQQGNLKGDWIQLDNVLLSPSTKDRTHNPTYECALGKARSRIQKSYPYGSEGGYVTTSGAEVVVAQNTNVNYSAFKVIRFEPMVFPPTFYVWATNGTKARMNKRGTTTLFNQLTFDISDTSATVTNNAVLVVGDVYEFHWQAEAIL